MAIRLHRYIVNDKESDQKCFLIMKIALTEEIKPCGPLCLDIFLVITFAILLSIDHYHFMSNLDEDFVGSLIILSY